jgi:vesicle-fusing ATPase
VSAPELLDRWVGGSEKLVRDLFADAEAELRMYNGDITKSGLYVVVIDEIDAVFRTRSSAEDSGEVARASAVNQILAKLDGINGLGNVLVIATTNRLELIDGALLRPGRLEVQVPVPLPSSEGRREILQIHFNALRKNGRLSKQLCRAIDGSSQEPLEGREWRPWSLGFLSLGEKRRTIRDIAADKWTRGFSGADLQGLVRCAGSIALSRARRDGNGVDGLLITVEDVAQALQEVKQ